MIHAKAILVILFKLGLYALSGILIGNGYRADNALLGTVVAFVGLVVFASLERRVGRALQSDRIETWLRHQGHSHVANRLHEEF